ncbi:MAG: glycosyltransferase family 2 protein [Chloroflexota bacterium]
MEPLAPPSWPSISVCMIVKDEAANLRPCIQALEDLASEVIVVDTGSTDDTAAIARGMGARVYPFDWIEDFAAARNESLCHATREWIFWLDADDRLSPGAVAQLKRAAASNRADAYMCLVASSEADGKQNTVEHIRLFKNGLGIRFWGGIHETVAPDLARLGSTVAATDIVVQHTGYESPERVRQKSARNLPVIEQEISRHPDQVDLLFYRGHSLTNLGRHDEALVDLQHYLRRSTPQRSFAYRRFLAYAASVAILDVRNDRADLEPLLGQALVEFPGHPHFLLLLARLKLFQGRAGEALGLLQEAWARLQKPVRGLRPRDAWIELATAESYRALGQKAEALEWARRARDHAPDWEMGGSFLARLYLDSDRIPEAEALLSDLLASSQGTEPWLLLSELRFRQARLDEAAAAIGEARSRGLSEEQAGKRLSRLKAAAALANTRTQSGSAAHQLGQQLKGLDLLAQRDFLGAAQCFAQAVEAAPTDPDGYRYLAAALKALGRDDEAIEAWKLANHWQRARISDVKTQ